MTNPTAKTSKSKAKYVKAVPKSAQDAALDIRDLALSNMDDQLRVPILQTWPEQGQGETIVLHDMVDQDVVTRGHLLMDIIQGTWRDADGQPFGGCVALVFGGTLQSPTGENEEALIIDVRENGTVYRFVQRYSFGDEGPEPEGQLAYWANAFKAPT